MQIKCLFLVVIEIGFYFFNSLSINSKITFNSSMELTLSSATLSFRRNLTKANNNYK